MKNRVIVFVTVVLFSAGLGVWFAKMQVHPPPEKAPGRNASSAPGSERPLLPRPEEGTSASGNVREQGNFRQGDEGRSLESEARAKEPAATAEKDLVGTEWGTDAFKLEFGPGGKLYIGGRARANWRVEGGRVKLYSDDGREVHWLDIQGKKLSWNGQLIDRFK